MDMTQNDFKESIASGLNKVPEITLYFWFIKVMCTTVGETAADYLNVALNFGLTGTSLITGLLLGIALFFQFKTKKYIPGVYWVSVMLISVFGTLVTDNLTDKIGVPLETSTIVFSLLLSVCFIIWYQFEKTLSIHSITTFRREAFYWLAILFTFALGTAAGDLMAEGLGLGYAFTGLIIAGLIVVFSVAWKMKLNHVLSFWLIYILTRPLGASIGDYLSQPNKYGGLGFGATVTSVIFLGGIFAIVLFLSVTKQDVVAGHASKQELEHINKDGILHTAIALVLLFTVGTIGYGIRKSELKLLVKDDQMFKAGVLKDEGSEVSSFSDVSAFQTIAQDTLEFIQNGQHAKARERISDLEYEWDTAEARLKPIDPKKWGEIDDKIDEALRELRALDPDTESEMTALKALVFILQN